MTALHFGLSAALVGWFLVLATFAFVDREHVAAPILALGFGAAVGGGLLACVGAVELLLFGLF